MTATVDNFDLIAPMLKFENEFDFYFVQIIQRKKEHKDSQHKLSVSNNNRCIKSYYIDSLDKLQRYELEMKELAGLFVARVCINLNRRNAQKLSFEMMKLLATNISCNHFNQLGKLYDTVSGQHHHDKNKTWIIDIDDKEYDSAIMESYINSCMPIGEDKIVAKVPTKSGYHIITRPFNLEHFNKEFPGVDIHKNNPTILYIP